MDLVRESQGSISIFFYDMPIILNGDWKSFENSLFHELLRNLSKLEVAEFFFFITEVEDIFELTLSKKFKLQHWQYSVGKQKLFALRCFDCSLL